MQYLIIAGIILVAVVGLFSTHVIVRVVCWILSIPPLAAGCLALWQGGIVEPFSTRLMIIFCSFAFLPAGCCTVGEIVSFLKKHESTN